MDKRTCSYSDRRQQLASRALKRLDLTWWREHCRAHRVANRGGRAAAERTSPPGTAGARWNHSKAGRRRFCAALRGFAPAAPSQQAAIYEWTFRKLYKKLREEEAGRW